MVWENNVPVIVMLLKLQEGGKIKGHVYWPQEIGMTCVWDDLSITLCSQHSVDEIVSRRFQIVHTKTGAMKELTQLHFMGWPDRGVPECPKSILSLYNLMSIYREQGIFKGLEGPPVVHCSAGVGRAGTFVTVALGIEKLKAKREEILLRSRSTLNYSDSALSESVDNLDRAGLLQSVDAMTCPDFENIDTYTIVYSLREQRHSAMVQSISQYIFIQQVLHTALAGFMYAAVRMAGQGNGKLENSSNQSLRKSACVF